MQVQPNDSEKIFAKPLSNIFGENVWYPNIWENIWQAFDKGLPNICFQMFG